MLQPKRFKMKGNKYLICKIWRVTYNFNKLVFQHIFIYLDTNSHVTCFMQHSCFLQCQKFHLDVETWQDSILQRKPELFVLHFLLHELHSTRMRVSLDIFFLCMCMIIIATSKSWWWVLLPLLLQSYHPHVLHAWCWNKKVWVIKN
jgi:hypothetical protein